MKFVIVALNASYIHTNLALRLLASSTEREVEKVEMTINDREVDVLQAILEKNPTHLFYSTYIWNIEAILHLSERIDKMGLGIKQYLGGPEVSYHGANFLLAHPWIEGVLQGEGEESFPKLLSALEEGTHSDVPGFLYREEDEIHYNPPTATSGDLDHLPALDYRGEDVSNKILYYESMRGCPYTCAYCLSADDHHIRYRSLEQVKADMRLLFQTGSRQIKFVDRSFGIHKERALALLEFMKEEAPDGINIHLEVNVEDLDDAIISALNSARPHLFQIEAGVQSMNPAVLAEIGRVPRKEKLGENMDKIDGSKVHRHLDLIVGLPGENLASFYEGFDFLYGLRPEKIQVGFLKLLYGTPLHRRAQALGLIYDRTAPYEIIRTPDLTGEEIVFLKHFADISEVFYDENRFTPVHTYYLKKTQTTPSAYFEALTKFYLENREAYPLRSMKGKYRLLYDFFVHSFKEDRTFYSYLKEVFYFNEDKFISYTLDVDDEEMSKGEVMEWLRSLAPAEYEILDHDIHRACRLIRGISFPERNFERLYFYQDHKYLKHIDRPLSKEG